VYVKQLKLLKNKSMRNLKIYVTALLLAGCSGGDPAPTPAPPSPPTPMINTPGAVTLSAPEKNKTCEPGAVVSDTQREVSF
jgi:uncharacterized lipoprotein YajG